MAKKKKRTDGLAFSTDDGPAAENPFAALSSLSNLPPAPASAQNETPEGPDEGAQYGPGRAGAMSNEEKQARRRMPLRVEVDRKYRRGKAVTLITGHPGPEEVIEQLGKVLKARCGVGGSVKDGVIIVQGDKRGKVVEVLRDEGYLGR